MALPSPRLSSRFNRLGGGVSRLGGLTQSQRELQPYIQQVKEEEEEKNRRLRPVQQFFDLLQRGQYFTANIAKEITDSVRTGEPLSQGAKDAALGALRGLTGKQKGTWQDVFFGEGGWMGEVPEEERKFKHKAVGFIGDILLDPTTYLSMGTAGVAKATAGVFAKGVLTDTIKRLGPDMLQKVAGKKRIEDIDKFLSGLTPNTKASKWAGDIYSKAFKDATTMSTSGLVEKYGIDVVSRSMPGEEIMRLADGGYAFTQARSRVTPIKKGEHPSTRAQKHRERGTLKPVTDEEGVVSYIDRMGIPQEPIAERFGRGSFRFMGKPLAEYGSRPIAKAWNEIGRAIGSSPVGDKLSNAWWSVMNTGIVGSLRKAFGFADSPYQRMLRLKNREIESGYHKIASDEITKVRKILGKLSEEDQNHIRDAIVTTYDANKIKPRSIDTDMTIGVDRTLGNNAEDWVEIKPDGTRVEHQAIYDIKTAERLKDAYRQLKTVSSQWRAAENRLYAEGTIKREVKLEIAYLPVFRRSGLTVGGKRGSKALGTDEPGFTKERRVSVSDTMKTNIAYIKASWDAETLEKARQESGLPTVDAYIESMLKEKNAFNINIDLEEAYAQRAMLHARAMTRSNMLNQFKEFGIKYNEIKGFKQGVPAFLKQMGGPAEGLVSVKDTALTGYVFDEDVAAIIDRMYTATNTDQGVKMLRDWWGWFTNTWKGWATLTPRFHFRNAISNWMTGFLKFGPRWMDPVQTVDSIVATHYGLHRSNYVDFLQNELNLSPSKTNSILEKRYGGLTLRELADIAVEKDVISKRTMGFDIEETVREHLGKESPSLNPASSKFVGFKWSRAAGDGIENQSRFNSFITDFVDAGGMETPGALEHASNEAKRWFLDYGDLTKFEQDVMKNVIPFYTWLRKNVANQMAGLVLYRDMYSLIPKAMGSFATDEDFDYELMPDWMQEEGFLPVSAEQDGRTMMLQPELAVMDVNMLPFTFDEKTMMPRLNWEGAARTITSAAHPIIKTIGEVLVGRDFFRDKDIKDGRPAKVKIGETEELRGRTYTMEMAPTILQYFANSPRAITFLDGMMRRSGFKEGIGVDVSRDDNRVVMDSRAQRILDNNLPALRLLAELLEAPEEVAKLAKPDVEDWIEEVSGKKDYHEGMNELFRLIGFWGGIRFREYEQDTQRQKQQESIMREAERLRQADRRYLPGYQNRSEGYWRDRNALVRRLVGS